MITVNNCPGEFYLLFNSEDTLVGTITNYWQWLDVRVQIKKEAVFGYYIKDKAGTVAKIDRKGSCQWEILDPYDNVSDLLMNLID